MDQTGTSTSPSKSVGGWQKSKHLKQWAAFLTLGCFAWGTSYLWIKIALEEIGPFMLVALRVTFGTSVIWLLVILFRIPLPRSRIAIRSGVLLGLTNMAIPFILISWGQTHISSGLAGILTSTTPLFTIVIAHLLLADEQITLPKLMGLVVGFGGIVLLFSRDLRSLGPSRNIWAQLAVVGATLSYAVSGVYTKRKLGDQHPIAIAAISLTAAMVLMWILMPIVEEPVTWPQLPLTWAAAAWLGIIGTSLAYPLLYFLIQTWGPTRTTLVSYVIPIVAVTLGIVLLGEMVEWELVLGGLLVLAGVRLVNWR